MQQSHLLLESFRFLFGPALADRRHHGRRFTSEDAPSAKTPHTVLRVFVHRTLDWLDVAALRQPDANARRTGNSLCIVTSLEPLEPGYYRRNLPVQQDENVIDHFADGRSPKMKRVGSLWSEDRNSSTFDGGKYHLGTLVDGHPSPPLALVTSVKPSLTLPPGFRAHEAPQ